MNKITITVEAGEHTLSRVYSLDTILDEQVDLNEKATEMLQVLQDSLIEKF